VVLVKLNIG